MLASRVNVFDGTPFAPDDDNVGLAISERDYAWGFGTNVDDPTVPNLDEPVHLVALLRDAESR